MAKTEVLTKEMYEEFSGGSGGPGTPGGNNNRDGKKEIPVKKIVIFLIAISVVTAFILCAVYFVGLYSNGIPSDTRVYLTERNNLVYLSWDSPTGEIIRGYKVKVTDMDDASSGEKVLFEQEYSLAEISSETGRCEVVIPYEAAYGGNRKYSINSVKKQSIIGLNLEREGTAGVNVTYNIKQPDNYRTDYNVDLSSGRISLSCVRGGEGEYTLYLKKPTGEKEALAYSTTTDGEITLDAMFGDAGFGLPNWGEEYTFSIECSNIADQLVFCDMNYDAISLGREEFLPYVLESSYSSDGKNRYTFTWNETKGSGYSVSVLNKADGSWQELKSFSNQEERVFETGKLDPCCEYTYKVEVLNPSELASPEVSVNELSFFTDPSAEFATVWPVANLPVYKESKGDEQINFVSAGNAVTVLDEVDGRFLIRLGMGDGAAEGYIDSNRCLINLPEYMGNMCLYDITNSYAATYTVHGYAIPGITGAVASGYDKVLLNDGTFIVPLLYPAAVRLASAGTVARQNGYILKVYDAFRPNAATVSLYKSIADAWKYPVPDHVFSRITVGDYLDGKKASVIELSDLKKAVKAAESEDGDETMQSEEAVAGSEDEKKKKKKDDKADEEVEAENSYGKTMTGSSGEYDLDSFLDSKVSPHNIGNSVDVTLVKPDTGAELEMQSGINDISVFSLPEQNNESSNLLKSIMESCGFSLNATKWYHFQDNNVSESFDTVAVIEGLSIEGWKRDENGWRYRNADGSYATGTATINEKEYSFDQNGYMEER